MCSFCECMKLSVHGFNIDGQKMEVNVSKYHFRSWKMMKIPIKSADFSVVSSVFRIMANVEAVQYKLITLFRHGFVSFAIITILYQYQYEFRYVVELNHFPADNNNRLGGAERDDPTEFTGRLFSLIKILF